MRRSRSPSCYTLAARPFHGDARNGLYYYQEQQLVDICSSCYGEYEVVETWTLSLSKCAHFDNLRQAF